MSNKPVLVIMAAGMGSRYGGLKQIDPVGPAGEIIIDYSIYDAKRAGFETVVCIIKHAIEKEFKEIMERGAARYMDVRYVFQELDDIPEGFSVPEGRVKPWGTAQAVLAAAKEVDGPFLVINADDYYGSSVFKTMYDYLAQAEDGEACDFCMAGYKIENTLTENGSVARGICVQKGDYLAEIEERLNVAKSGSGAKFSTDGGETWTDVPEGTLVSMNCFGYTKSIFKELEARFPEKLRSILAENPMKGEYLIPMVTGALVKEGKATVRVLPTHEKWYGVTYHEDRESVVKAMREMTDRGLYPEKLWP